MTAKTKRLGGEISMAEIQRKCAEKQLKKRTGNWFLPGLMIVLLLVGAAAVTCLHFGIQDQKRAARLLSEAKQERETLLENVENPDRDTFLSVEGKVVIGFLQIPSQNAEYAILNTFDANTASFSLCREGTSMPWDAQGMTVYGISAFTKCLSELQEKDQLIFEDLAGTQYHYQYIKESEEVIDHGIRIISSDKDKNEKAVFQFELLEED